jgi:hypothetical protein
VPPESSRLAIDLSSSLIRVLDGVMGGNMRSGAVPLPESAWNAGKVSDPNAVGQAIKQLLARTEIVQTRAHVAVSDAVATFRVLDLERAASDQQVSAAVAKELALDPERFASRWVDVGEQDDRRTVYAAAWDRATMKGISDAMRVAGLDPVVVELKSAALARTVSDRSCIVLDLVSNPAEIVIIDRHLPQLWHGFELKTPVSEGLEEALATQLRSVIRFYKRRRDTSLGPTSPLLVASEQVLPGQLLNDLSDIVGQPARALVAPPRVPTSVRHSTYLTCLGLIMRRDP